MRLSKKLETQLNSYKEFNENQILLHELNKALRQRDQYKAERDTLIDDLSWYKAKVSRLEDEKDDMLLEREYYKNLYEDMTRRGKEMERENRFLLSRKDNLFDSWRDENKRSVALSKKLEQLKQDLLRTEELQDEIIQLEKDFENKHSLLSEISQHIGNKPSSSTYKYFRAKLDGIGIKEGE
ncbi:MAG: hypothetical protein L0J01_09360 [Tetragenococcus halophilus]|nr:hypothetical protein [Tetragenococcus halophilus]